MKRMGAKSTVAHQSELLQEHSLRGYPTENWERESEKLNFFPRIEKWAQTMKENC